MKLLSIPATQCPYCLHVLEHSILLHASRHKNERISEIEVFHHPNGCTLSGRKFKVKLPTIEGDLIA